MLPAYKTAFLRYFVYHPIKNSATLPRRVAVTESNKLARNNISRKPKNKAVYFSMTRRGHCWGELFHL